MKNIFLITLFITYSWCLFAQPQQFKGYPEKGMNLDILPGFRQPPKGYGNVPFYWWNGDKLEKERLKEQLDILSSAPIDGFAVSYMHLNPTLEIDEKKGRYGLFGNTEPGDPYIFSEEWWDIWNWFAKECAVRNIGLGLDDYTVGWTGNGFYPDELLANPVFTNYQGKLEFKKIDVRGGSSITEKIPENLLTIVEWPGGNDLSKNINQGFLTWKAPQETDCRVYIISTKENFLIHPDHGKELVKVYFDRFEKQMGDAAEKGMNYFFQDEMLYPITMGTWSEDFASEFFKRKKYDILPYLPALIDHIGPITPKIRLDYCDVLVDLAGERYMKPIYNWHAERGLLYGSDNLGRGMMPGMYVDYFRINSWYTAPGNDAPAKGSSFLQTKVSSSISHLYERPRTWLEAFHSMGWGSSGEWLTRQIDHHMIAGGNLVCMHGLYYSTHGGWWEWAPPCFHFRMPYWPHMKKWLEYTERMSYVLSQGQHVCDIALMYPTEPIQAYPDASEKLIFDIALQLSNAGLDYDFINYTSLIDAQVGNGYVHTAGEKYKIIVLADMKAMHHSSLLRVLEHYRNGGIVLAKGQLPLATTNKGENDPEVDLILKELFGLTALEALSGKKGEKQVNSRNGIGWYLSENDLVGLIRSLIIPDFDPGEGGGKVLHRKAGDRDVYMVMDVQKGTECFFRATGKVELWDPANGTITEYPVRKQNAEGTWLKLEKEASNSYLFVFSPGNPWMQNAPALVTTPKAIRQIPIEGTWEVELLPTMNNKWGDYRFPVSDEFISAEARSFIHMPNDKAGKGWYMPGYDDSSWFENIYGYGLQAESYCIPPDKDLESVLNNPGQLTDPENYLEFSWQYGVWDNPGSQGYHGLKGKVSDGFFILDQGAHQIYKTSVYVPSKDMYRIEIEGIQPDHILINGNPIKEQSVLDKGWHSLLIAYANTTKTEFKMQPEMVDLRNRSAVVLFPASVPTPEKPSVYDKIISMKWNKAPHLLFDPYKGTHLRWNYRFWSVPGTREMNFRVAGKDLKIWFNGKPVHKRNIRLLESTPEGVRTYQVIFDKEEKEVGLVAFSIERNPGYQGAAVVCEPIRIKTGKGLLKAGDWSVTGALKYYSGGMYYRKNIQIETLKEDEQILLDLGNVVASCEVKINGISVGILMSPPYETDITNYIKTGNNEIEILVYSTLANHYQTVPTPFRGDPVAGLLGPVQLLIKSTSGK